MIGVLSLWLALQGSPAQAQVSLHPLFSRGAVLQRDLPLAIWGRAPGGAKVSVSLGATRAATTATADGRFRVVLAPFAAAGPLELAVAIEDAQVVRVEDVWIGEVWLASGQSNMGWPLAESAELEEALELADEPRLSFFQVEQAHADTRRETCAGRWVRSDRQVARGFSAVAFHFARGLLAELDCAVGILQADYGGLPAEAFAERSALEADPGLAPSLARFARKEKSQPGAVFNAMIAPLAPCALRGVVFYQGESNVAQAEQYRRLFPALIRSWRRAFERELPFVYVQLPGFGERPATPVDSPWAELREAQALALALPSTAMVCALDQGEGARLHPLHKRDIGRRLAAAALRLAHQRDLVARGPVFESWAVEGAGVRVRFAGARAGLALSSGQQVSGFAVADAQRRWHWVGGTLDGDSVLLELGSAPVPVALRYGWADEPGANLQDTDGWPVEPFRTDDWPLSTAPKSARR